MSMEKYTREVFCEDALKWLENYQDRGGVSFLGSLPDFSEFPSYTLAMWKEWFQNTAELILRKTSPEGVTIFFQSDIKHNGLWVDKAYLIQKAAEKAGHELLWHKIFCRAPAGTVMFGRPAYSHMLCFSKTVIPDLSKSTADVIPDLGDKTWTRGMGLSASLMAGAFIKKHTSTTTLINPFCGEGSVLAAANYCGLNAVGIEKSPKRAQKARSLQVSPDGKSWHQAQ
ncbi:MAG: SAM-dependent methyltransferase [Bacteriovoracia bacterium]